MGLAEVRPAAGMTAGVRNNRKIGQEGVVGQTDRSCSKERECV